MNSFMMHLMNTYGYLGIAFLITAENLFPPIPSEVILTFGGFMTTYTRMNIIGVVISATVGSVLGAIVLYQAGHLISKSRLERLLTGKIGGILHFKKDDVEHAAQWFDSQGNYTVFFCRFIPIVRSLISIPAGMAEMGFPKFLLLTTLGSVIWNLVLVSLGAIAGASWQKIVVYMGTYSQVAKIVMLIFAAIGIIWFLYKRK